MKEVYVYYENYLKKITSSTTINFEVFENYKKAHDFMLSRRNEILVDKKFILDKNETGNDKSWLRIHFEDNYLDLVIEKREIR